MRWGHLNVTYNMHTVQLVSGGVWCALSEVMFTSYAPFATEL